MRVLVIGVCVLAAAPAVSATIDPWHMAVQQGKDVGTANGFIEVLAAFIDSYRDIAGPQPAYSSATIPYAFGLALYALAIAALVPRLKRYPSWAALAMSRMRWTMARKPLDRCDDR